MKRVRGDKSTHVYDGARFVECMNQAILSVVMIRAMFISRCKD